MSGVTPPGRALSRKVALAGVTALVAAAAFWVVAEVRERQVRAYIMRSDPELILADASRAGRVLEIGRAGFKVHCASCHGDGRANRAHGVPDLTDRDFLYGHGQVAEIEQIVLHGIRSGDPRGWNLAAMPAYGRARPYAAEAISPLTPVGIRDVTQYVLHLAGRPADTAAAARGRALYGGVGACWDCHAADGRGDEAVGAPNLIDQVWLYGDGSPATIARSIADGHAGISPAFVRILSPTDARAIAIYAASLAQPDNKEPARD